MFLYDYFLKVSYEIGVLVPNPYFLLFLEVILLICQFQVEGLATPLTFYHVYFCNESFEIEILAPKPLLQSLLENKYYLQRIIFMFSSLYVYFVLYQNVDGYINYTVM